jgi:hypothetical protein
MIGNKLTLLFASIIVLSGLYFPPSNPVSADEIRKSIGQAPPIGDIKVESLDSTETNSIYVVHYSQKFDKKQLSKYGKLGTQVDSKIELTTDEQSIKQVRNISWVKSVRPTITMEPSTTDTPQ